MKRTFANISHDAFRQIFLVIAVIAGALSFLFFEIFQGVYSYAKILIHKIATDCGCAQMTQLITMHPWIFGSLMALGLIAASFVSYAVYQLVRLSMQTRNFTIRFLVKAKSRNSDKLAEAMMHLKLEAGKIIEIQDARATVFCFGILRSRIIISDGLIKILRQDELEAVLSHEHQHLISRDPLKLFIIRYCQRVFFFLPGLSDAIRKYLIYSELAADESATTNFTDKSKLARALLKIAEAEERQLLRRGLALSFFSSAIAERVRKLADNSYAPKFQLPGRRLLFGLSAIAVTGMIVFVFLLDSASALEMHGHGGCNMNPLAQGDNGLVCDSMVNRQTCSQNSHNHSLMAGCGLN